MESKRYLLKGPIHLLNLDTLVKTFPDASLVYTHRPLSKAVPSTLSLFQHVLDPIGVDTNSDKWIKRYGIVLVFGYKVRPSSK